ATGRPGRRRRRTPYRGPAEGELDLALGAGDRLDPHLARGAEPIPAPGTATHERGRRVVELEELARKAPRGQEALEHLTEAHEQDGADQPRDLADPGLLPPTLAQSIVEQPGEAQVVGQVLDLCRLPL